MRRARHGWRARRKAHSIPARRIHSGALGTLPVR